VAISQNALTDERNHTWPISIYGNQAKTPYKDAGSHLRQAYSGISEAVQDRHYGH